MPIKHYLLDTPPTILGNEGKGTTIKNTSHTQICTQGHRHFFL